jgi:hypothetical protein
MKYGQYLQDNKDELFRGCYVDYEGLKKVIEDSAKEYGTSGGPMGVGSDRVTSITMAQQVPTLEVSFYDLYEKQVRRPTKAPITRPAPLSELGHASGRARRRRRGALHFRVHSTVTLVRWISHAG